MNITIPALKKGDTIAIVAPAKAIEQAHVDFAKEYLINEGFNVIIGKNIYNNFNYFSGTDEERTSDFQEMLDNPDVKAILCARGGYGAIRISDKLQWASQLREPKWIIGFSDITVFHQKMQRFGIESIHATMPLNFAQNSADSLQSLIKALKNESYSIQCASSIYNREGVATGKLIGGNLSILYSLLGTDDQPDYTNTILFIEDVGEQLYSLDRMIFAFQKAGVLKKINGLIIGGMTDLQDTATPTGFTIEQVILDQFEFANIPIVFNFPAGHVDDNQALILGREVLLTVAAKKCSLDFPAKN